MLNSIDDVLAHWPAEEHWPVTGVRDRVADLLQRFDDLEQLHRFWTVVREMRFPAPMARHPGPSRADWPTWSSMSQTLIRS